MIKKILQLHCTLHKKDKHAFFGLTTKYQEDTLTNKTTSQQKQLLRETKIPGFLEQTLKMTLTWGKELWVSSFAGALVLVLTGWEGTRLLVVTFFCV